MLDRIIIVATAHIAYLCLGIAFLFVTSLIAAKGPMTTTTLISAIVFIPLVGGVLLSVTGLPSAIYSSVIYGLGGFFHQRVAMVIAIIGGSVVLQLALNGRFPRDWKYTLTTFDIAALLVIYVSSWIGTFWFLPKFKVMASI